VLITRMLGRTPELAFADAVRSLSALDWTGRQGKPGIITYLPPYHGNPYQELIYSELSQFGLHAAPVYDTEMALKFVTSVANGGLDVVVHVHWLNFVTIGAEDEVAARASAKEFLDDLYAAKDLGARLLWTIHNILPHDDRYPDVNIELRRAMVDIVDRFHVMSPRTQELVSPWFEVPEEKTFVVPHPSYHGVYPSWMSREAARSRLGIAQSAIVFLMIGAVKPYKGLTELLDAFDELTRREPGHFVLLVAGQPSQDEETERFRKRVLAHPAVFGAFGRIPHEEMQVYLRAADIGVFPYRRSLNSGAMALTMTFGLPAVLPSHSGAAAGANEAYAEIYDASDPDGLLNSLSAARRLASPTARAAASAASDQISVKFVAGAFARAVRSWIGDPHESAS
jgi:beta-1,4-mannosyltransferase